MRIVSILRRLAPRLFTSFRLDAAGNGLPVQTGALPWRRNPVSDQFEVLLITSRSSGAWIIPKGWPMRRKSLAEAAAIEAFEEAGVEGVVDEEPIGSFEHLKRRRFPGATRFLVVVHAMKVERALDDWPERALS